LLPDRDNTADHELIEVKKRLSDRLLPLDFVSGVGSRGATLTIYLARALAPDEQHKVRKILAVEAPATPVEFVTTGEFKAH
jgi:hypothetical protein